MCNGQITQTLDFVPSEHTNYGLPGTPRFCVRPGGYRPYLVSSGYIMPANGKVSAVPMHATQKQVIE